MDNKKVQNTVKSLMKEYCQIRSEVDTFMGKILEWTDELGGVIEKLFAAKRESPSFKLPKTPSEKKTRNRKIRKALHSKCSVLNSTVEDYEITNLDDTVSTRTRAARTRAATSKMSQFNLTRDKQSMSIEVTKETLTVEKVLSDETFVVPQTASTRTKPVIRKKQETVEPEPVDTMTKIELTCSPIVRPSRKKISRTLSRDPVERPSRNRTLRNRSSSAASRKNISSPVEQPSRNKTLKGQSKSPELLETFSGTFTRSPVERPSRSKSPETRPSRKKVSRTLSNSPECRASRNKISRTLSHSPVSPYSRRTLSKTPTQSLAISNKIQKVSETLSKGSPARSSRNKVSTTQESKTNTPKNVEERNESMVNKTVTIKREATPKVSSTSITLDEAESDRKVLMSDEDKTPKVRGGRFTRISKTSTPMIDGEKTPLVNCEGVRVSDDEMVTSTETDNLPEGNTNATYSLVQNLPPEESKESPIPKKKRKLKKDEETCKENIEEIGDSVRITRTKSKAIKQMMEENENKQMDLTAFAKKIVNKAKMASLKKNQMVAMLENDASTPKNGSNLINNIQFGTLASKSKYHHLLLSSSKKIKTPLITLPNSAVKIVKGSGEKDWLKPKIAKRDSSVENMVRTATKLPKDDPLAREILLKSKKEKEEEAALKRQNVIKTKQEELKRKNELKHQLAMKQREKLEQEKYNNMIQSEKEKEERHKLILQERQMKLKEEAFKKKMLTQQKIAETVERRRIEEEARIAKLKEQEAEEQRIALEKQKEQERQEKRAQERLAQKKAREEYELQLKQELEAERLKEEMAAKKIILGGNKLQSASKRPKFGLLRDKKDWDYKPRNENDYGLDDEHSELESEDERSYDKSKPAIAWAKKIMDGKNHPVKILNLEMLAEFLPCYQKSPDIHKMFKMTPSKRIKRSSSAIWNTPSS